MSGTSAGSTKGVGAFSGGLGSIGAGSGLAGGCGAGFSGAGFVGGLGSVAGSSVAAPRCSLCNLCLARFANILCS